MNSTKNQNKKSNKNIILPIILILTIIIILALIGYYIYNSNNYPLEKVKGLVMSTKLPSTYSLIKKSYNNNNECFLTLKCFKKNEKAYIERYTNDSKLDSTQFIDLEKPLITQVNEDSKTIITNSNINTTDLDTQLGKRNFDLLSNKMALEHYDYQYLNKEKFNNKNCIKISFTSKAPDESNNYYRYYFYIDLKTNLIVKKELHIGNDLNSLKYYAGETYEYTLNNVNDTDIKEFNIDNYPNYHKI